MSKNDKSLESIIKSVADDAKLEPRDELWERVQLRTIADDKPSSNSLKSLIIKISSIAAIFMFIVMGKTIIDKNDELGISRYDLSHYVTSDLASLDQGSTDEGFSFDKVHKLRKAYNSETNKTKLTPSIKFPQLEN